MKQTNEALFSISGFQMNKQIMKTNGNHFSKIALTKTQGTTIERKMMRENLVTTAQAQSAGQNLVFKNLSG